jgi:hypothetical protein
VNREDKMNIFTAAKIVKYTPWSFDYLMAEILWPFIKDNKIKLTEEGKKYVENNLINE